MAKQIEKKIIKDNFEDKKDKNLTYEHENTKKSIRGEIHQH